MDILSLVEDAKKQHLSFEKHPAKDLDMEQKTHYLNGLALLMNVDEEIHEKEKEYMIILLRTFDLPDEKLEEFIQFARNPDKKAVLELITSFTERDIKYVFLFDCLMLAHRDDKFEPTEQKLIEDYFEMFKLTAREKEQIFYLHDKIIKQDKKGLYRLFQQKDTLKRELYTYLMDYYELNVENITEEYLKDIKEEIGKIEFFKVKFFGESSYGSQDGTSVIMDKPVSNKLFAWFLQYLLDTKKLVLDGTKLFAEDKSLLFDLSISNIELNNGTFEFKKNDNITGFSLNGVIKFIEWINSITNISFSLPQCNSYYNDSDYGYYKFDSVDGKSFYNELVVEALKKRYVKIKGGKIEGQFNFSPKEGLQDDNEILDGITFRLQKLEKEENED